MPQFAYKAKDDNGRTVKGVVAADNEDALELALRKEGQYLLSYRESKAKQVQIRKKKLKRKELITFTTHLATILSTGASLTQGLQDLAIQTDDPGFRVVIEDLLKNIEAGHSLSKALARYPRLFSEIYVRIVEAGEASGNVDQVLFDLVGFLEWQEEMSGNITQATYYPGLIFTAIIGLIFVLFTFVFPKFKGILLQFNVPLPLPTRVVMTLSNFMVKYWLLIIAIIAGVIIFQRVWSKTPQGRLFFDRLKLRIPVIGPLLRKISLSRFAHYFGMLFRSGVELSQALETVENLVGNAVLSQALNNATKQVKAGKFISDALRETEEFPPMVIRMIGIGESTGELEGTLKKVCDFYNREIPATIKKLFAVIEPLAIIFLALVVLGVATAIYLPMYQVMSAVGGTPR